MYVFYPVEMKFASSRLEPSSLDYIPSIVVAQSTKHGSARACQIDARDVGDEEFDEKRGLTMTRDYIYDVGGYSGTIVF